MAAVTQAFGPGAMPSTFSDNLSTPGFFTSAIHADDSINPFDDSINRGTLTVERKTKDNSDSLGDSKPARPSYSGYPTDDLAAEDSMDMFFGFSPRRQLSPPPDQGVPNLAHGLPGVETSMWMSSKLEDRLPYGQQPAVKTQEPSPPQSIDNSPVEWTYRNSQPLLSPLHAMLLESHTANTRPRSGPVTPSADGSYGLLEDANYINSFSHQSIRQPRDAGPAMDAVKDNLKRKRSERSTKTGDVSGSKPSAPKRQRKSNTRSKPNSSLPKGSAPVQEDVKRYKFLERNRIAASKCRQKKKEWTGNLEAKARNLQNSKNQLAMMVNSLKDEMLFLKGELLKHSNCNCTRIRDYLEHEVTNLARPPSTDLPSHESPGSRSSSSHDIRGSSTSDDVADGDAEFLDEKKAQTNDIRSQDQGSSDFQHHTDKELHALLSAQLGQAATDQSQ